MNSYFKTRINEIDSELEESTGLTFKISQPERGFVQFESSQQDYEFIIRIPNDQILENRISKWKYCSNPSKQLWVDRNSRNFYHDVFQIVEYKQFDPEYLRERKNN